jgi:chromosome segregation ATPase
MEVAAMTESLKELAAKSLTELGLKHDRLLGDIAEAEAELADLQAKKAVTVAELERVTAALKERQQQHEDCWASLQVIRKEKDAMRRLVYDDPPRSFLEGMGRRQA